MGALAVALFLACPLGAEGKPKAESRDDAASRLERKAIQAYVAGDTASAVRSLEQALRGCDTPDACTRRTRASVHVTLGTIRGAGQDDYASAKRQFVFALGLDPDARLAPALATDRLRATFEEARAEASSASAPARSEKPVTTEPPNVSDLIRLEGTATPPPPPPKPVVQPKPPVDPGPQPRWGWVSLRAISDFSFLSDSNVCSPGAPSSYVCSEESGARYTGRPQPNDDVSAGFAASTLRLVVGYERLLFSGLTAGAFAGFALPFSGAPEGRSGMFPLHLELRGTYTFGEAPYVDTGPARFHPFVYLSLGLAEIDTTVTVRVYEIPCGSRPALACRYDLDAHRRIGRVYTTLGGGARYRIDGPHAIRAGVRASLVFDGGFVFSPEIAYELGI